MPHTVCLQTEYYTVISKTNKSQIGLGWLILSPTN